MSLRASWHRAALGISGAALSVFLLELAALTLRRWSMIASLWELQFGSLWVFPACFVGLWVVAALAWAWLSAVAAARPVGRWLSVLGWALFAGWVGFGVSHGRHFDLWWRRAGFIALLAVGGGALAYWAAPRLLSWWRQQPGRLAAGAFVVAMVLELVNATVLVRLYPAFHSGLAVFTVVAVTLCIRVLVARRLSAVRPWLAGALGLGLLVASGGALRVASERLARFDNFRLLVSEAAPVLSHGVALAGRLAPPPPLSGAGETEAGVAPGQGPSFEGRDILLISIDALRADHVGAYGYSRNTTPNIDRLAGEGALFRWAYCATPHTSYSVTSLMTGKYIRPLLLQGAGEHSDTWASLLRTYGFRTAAFYPPAVFFIDRDRFKTFDESQFGFEYKKREFLEGEPRVRQVVEYLDEQPARQRLFTWVHLFGPHEPYEAHPEFDFGPKDVDRYDAEIAAADRTVGRIVEEFRKRRPGAVVIITSDHGEEFGEHGGRYHGSSVYEEQVRVPLVISAPGAMGQQTIEAPVQTIDLLPTVLGALSIPTRPRLRGRDLRALMGRGADAGPGFAYAETDDYAMLAQGKHRLICQRQLGACRLYDVTKDPLQQQDIARTAEDDVERLRARLRSLNASHGEFERRGLRAEGKGWPPAILRGIAGDGDAAVDIAALLDDADVEIRRKAAELLLRLRRSEVVDSLRLALQREEDQDVLRYCALALTRLGEGASMTVELLEHREARWRRWAALTLAENGDKRGEAELLAWWQNRQARDHRQSVDILQALGNIRSQRAVPVLLRSLDDVRLRPLIAEQLATIGDDAARGTLAQWLAKEPYQTARVALAQSLERLGAENELVVPMRRWLGVPDPIEGGLGIAARSGILAHVGGPPPSDMRKLVKNAHIGELVTIVVPKTGDGRGLRLLARAENTGAEPQALWLGTPHHVFSYDREGHIKRAPKVPEIHPKNRISLNFPPSAGVQELHMPVPASLGLSPGKAAHVVVLAGRQLRLEALAVLPLQAELQPTRKSPEGQKGDNSPAHSGAEGAKQ